MGEYIQYQNYGWKKYWTMGPLVPEKNLIPRKYYPRKIKIVIIY